MSPFARAFIEYTAIGSLGIIACVLIVAWALVKLGVLPGPE